VVFIRETKMIEQLNQQTKERVNHAIANIRLIATRVKRASILDAVGRAEIVVNFLNEFRQHVNAVVDNDRVSLAGMSFRYADTVYSHLTRERKKTYDQEFIQVSTLLENIHAYVSHVIEKGQNHA
jgi:hypothetical protein